MGTFVAGSHELSPSINYLLHNKILSGQIKQQKQQRQQHQHHQKNHTDSGSSDDNPNNVNQNTSSQSSHSSSDGFAGRQVAPGTSYLQHHHFRQVSPIPPLPPIKSEAPISRRQQVLTVEQYERDYRESASDLDLIERIYYGGIATNQLRATLWPYLFGLVKHRGRFKEIGEHQQYAYVEHEENIKRWKELEKLYHSYQGQWESIMPDQELRFSTFRERKSLIERDVIRSDRSHPFYAENSRNLATLTTLLMSYMMYDFDIGYLQGMSDLAAPILYVFGGDLVKSFWVFVEVMKLFRRNFEQSQKTIHFQLNCLFRLIKITDSKFASYLNENECSNCFFAFRQIVCQFKRELKKNNEEDDYSKVLTLWDTIWSVQRRHELLAKSSYVHTFTIANQSQQRHLRYLQRSARNGFCNGRLRSRSNSNHRVSDLATAPVKQEQIVYTKATFYSSFDPNQADVPRFELSETEKFVLSLCLSLIRRERNYILQERLDASEIHQHFINPRLASNLDNFIESAYHIYNFLNTDCDMQLLIKGFDMINGGGAQSLTGRTTNGCGGKHQANQDSSPIGCHQDNGSSSAADTYDLLRDYLIISPSSYNTSRYKYSVSQKSWDHFINNTNGHSPTEIDR